MTVEAATDLLEQFGRGVQVEVGRTDVHMAHIGGQPRQSGIDVLPFLVPSQQPMNREGVTIMPRAA